MGEIGVEPLTVSLDVARRWVEAILRQDYDAAQAFFDSDVVSETPRGLFNGAIASREAIENATGGYDHIELEHSEPQFEEVGDDVIVRTRDIGRWRESGDVAFERDLDVRVTIDGDRITRVVVSPAGHSSG